MGGHLPGCWRSRMRPVVSAAWCLAATGGLLLATGSGPAAQARGILTAAEIAPTSMSYPAPRMTHCTGGMTKDVSAHFAVWACRGRGAAAADRAALHAPRTTLPT